MLDETCPESEGFYSILLLTYMQINLKFQDTIHRLTEENNGFKENHSIEKSKNKDMIRELQEQKSQLLEENNQLRSENDQLMEVQGQDLKEMEEKLHNLLESYGERSKYIHSWSK